MPWELPYWDSPVASLETLAAGATGGPGETATGLGANQFLHDLDEVMRPFSFVNEAISYSKRLSVSRTINDDSDPDLQLALIELLSGVAPSSGVLRRSRRAHRLDVRSAAARVIGSTKSFQANWTPAGMRIIRFLAENWRRDEPHAPMVVP